MSRKNNLVYRIRRFNEYNYPRAEIEVWPDLERTSGTEVPLRFTWQTSRQDDGKWDDWYAFRVVIEVGYKEHFEAGVRLANRIMKAVNGDDDYWRKTAPEAILTALERLGLEVVYDGRSHDFVPATEVAPDGHRCWWDDGGGYVSVMAETEAEAKRLIALKMAEQHSWRLMQWIEAGMLVRAGRETRMPNVTPGRVQLALNGKEGNNAVEVAA